MILRSDQAGLTLIRQTDHAQLCGAMARAWGDAGFERPRPAERVAVAAAEHDNGWAEWEAAPRVNPETGRPYTYSDIPVDQHLAIYRRGIARAAALDAYVGLLVSLHGSTLYSRYRAGQPGVQGFLDEQRELRSRLLERLADDDAGARPHSSDTVLETNRDLLLAWDALSLFLCEGRAWMDHLSFPTDYEGRRTGVSVHGSAERWTLDPYPFDIAPVELYVPAVRTERHEFRDDAELAREIESARPSRLRFLIAPDGPGAI